jgi:flagellar biosynthesis protein
MNDAPKAVALKYDEITAPRITAKGDADLAAEIISIARQHGVPLYENEELVQLLATLDLGEEIPEALYRVIAEIIAFAYYLQGKTPEGFVPENNSHKPNTDTP